MINFAKLANYRSESKDQELFKEILLINFIFTVVGFLIVFSVINILIHHIYGAYILSISAIFQLILVFSFIKKKISYIFTVNTGILLGASFLFSDIYLTNGITSPSLPWIILPPIISFILLEKSTSTRIWIFTSILIVLFFGLLKMFHIELDNKIDPAFFSIYYTTSYIGLVFMLVVIANLFENKKNRIFNELEAKQKELLESKNRFKTMFDKAPLGIGVTNSNTGIIAAMNERFSEIIGYSKDEIINLSWMDMTHPDDIQYDLDNMQKMNTGEISGFKLSKRYIRKDKSVIWVDVAITPIDSEDKENPYHLCMIEDITEKREAEVIVRNRELLIQQNVLLELSLLPSEMAFEEKIKNILIKAAQSLNCEYTSFWIIKNEVISTEYYYRLSNNDFIEGNSYRKDQCPIFFQEMDKKKNIVVNNVMEDLVTKEFVNYFEKLKIVSLMDIPLRRGNEIIGIFSFEHVGNVRNWTRVEEVFSRSISDFGILAIESEELKQTKEMLKINEDRWKFAIQGSSDGLWDWNVDTSEVYRSPRWYEMLGYKEEDIKNNVDEWLNRIHKDDLEEVNAEIQKHFQNENLSYSTEHRVLCQDGSYKWILDRGKIISRDKQGIPLRIIGTTTDITKHKTAEEELLQSKGKFQAIFTGSNDAILLLTEHGFFDCNPKAIEMFGMDTKEEMINSNLLEISPEYQLDGIVSLGKAKEMIDIAYKKGVNRFEWLLKQKKGHIFPAEILLSAFDYGGDRVLQATVQDITERKLVDEKIKHNEEKYRSLIENSPEIILIVGRDELVEFSNNTNRNVKQEDIIGHHLYEFVDEKHHDMIRKAHQNIFNGAKYQSYETEGNTKDGVTSWFLTHVGPKYLDDKVVGLVLFIRNISDRKHAEEKIKQSLHEKEVLLKEVHHRVKNNLQIISSILNLQSSTISDEQTLDLLKNSQDRIRSMSLIHELLYQTKDFSTIVFSEYIRSISTNLFQSYNQNRKVELILDLNDVSLDLDMAIPCGLIVNELLTNSLKYAFSIQDSGIVKIHLSQSEDDIIIIIEDNGKGFPDSIDFKDTESLGMQLVVSLIDQIDGEIKLDGVNGTKYELKFKNVQSGVERLESL